jgi:hypothetical protein
MKSEDRVREKGINELVADRSEVFLSQGDGRRADASSLALGFHTVVNGLEMTLEQYGKFAQAAREDHGVGEAVQWRSSMHWRPPAFHLAKSERRRTSRR